MTRPDFDDARQSHLANRYIRGKRIQTCRPVLFPTWFRRGDRADREQAVTEIICCREKVAALRLCGIEQMVAVSGRRAAGRSRRENHALFCYDGAGQHLCRLFAYRVHLIVIVGRIMMEDH